MAEKLARPDFSQSGWYGKYFVKQVSIALAFGSVGGAIWYAYKTSLHQEYLQSIQDAQKRIDSMKITYTEEQFEQECDARDARIAHLRALAAKVSPDDE
mmetsp:Transcript_4123/g.12552  ORF Transcript_4123/g.12552 Transcript_4123/m.12552 type:complete len:99 (-) Transcript_4123:56-352(-)